MKIWWIKFLSGVTDKNLRIPSRNHKWRLILMKMKLIAKSEKRWRKNSKSSSSNNNLVNNNNSSNKRNLKKNHLVQSSKITRMISLTKRNRLKMITTTTTLNSLPNSESQQITSNKQRQNRTKQTTTRTKSFKVTFKMSMNFN